MGKDSYIRYFLDGFSLANRSYVIFIILLLFSIPTLVPIALPNLFINKFLPLVSLIVAIFSIGFRLSMPLFLLEKQDNKSLNINNMINIAIKNVRRIILPSILFIFLFGILAVVALVVLVILLQPTKEQIPELIQGFRNQSQGWHPIFLIPNVVFAFLAFTSIFFALENQGLLSSIKSSIFISFKNLPFITLIITIGIISYSITSFLPIEFWGLLLRIVIGTYISFVVVASTLYYYQKRVKTEN